MAATTDSVLEAAVDLAREVVAEVSEHGVGEHLGFYLEGDRVGTHRFAALEPGYVGWHWAVVMSRAPRSRTATVSEVELLPGRGALLAPAWLPWSERLRPGDVGPGDVLPYQPDDPRLEQGYEQTSDEDADRLAIYELGLGRPRVLSPYGRDEAFKRWYEGDHGPNSDIARKAKAQCSTCGFFMKMAGSARLVFGVCANEWSPSDGRVVSMDHGCGAHSETDEPKRRSDWVQSDPVIDEGRMDVIERGELEPAVVDHAEESGSAASAPATRGDDAGSDAQDQHGTHTQGEPDSQSVTGRGALIVPGRADVATDASE